METSLHKQLKHHYAGPAGDVEIVVDGFRVDALKRGRLIEIQHGSLSAIRHKIRTLAARHRLTVVKPLIGRKTIVRCAKRGGEPLTRRLSPKHGRLIDIFAELIYFRDVFPHSNLQLEVPIVSVEEWRYPGHGRRRRRRQRDFEIEDQKLIGIENIFRIRQGTDLLGLLPIDLPEPFGTQQLSQLMGIDRASAQRIAYCLREMKLVRCIGKSGNSLLYSLGKRVPSRKPA
jgi:hypothetical protein